MQGYLYQTTILLVLNEIGNYLLSLIIFQCKRFSLIDYAPGGHLVPV